MEDAENEIEPGLDARAALDVLVDEVYLWRLSPEVKAELVVVAAADALVAGNDSPHLRELAGLSRRDDFWTVHDTASRALEELIGEPMPVGTEAIATRALQAMCRRLLAGNLTPRELTSWAHSYIRHEGPEELQELVTLDDDFDIAVEVNLSEAEIARRVREEARRTLGLPSTEPDPVDPTRRGRADWFARRRGSRPRS